MLESIAKIKLFKSAKIKIYNIIKYKTKGLYKKKKLIFFVENIIYY